MKDKSERGERPEEWLRAFSVRLHNEHSGENSQEVARPSPLPRWSSSAPPTVSMSFLTQTTRAFASRKLLVPSR